MTIVLHSCPVWLPQTQVWLYNQIRALPPTIESHVACLSVENRQSFPQPNLHCLAGSSRIAYRAEALLRKLGIPIQPIWLAEVARRCRADTLHSHFGNMGWLNLSVARRRSLPHIVTFYGLDVEYLPRQDARWRDRYLELFAEVDWILCEGPHMASRIVAQGCPEAKVRVHHLGIDTAAIPFRPRIYQAGAPLRVLIAGAFREKKGFPYALQALGALRHRVDLEITIVGDAGIEPRSIREKRQILNVIRNHHLEPSVRMLGFQSHAALMAEAYRHHVFVSPSVHATDGDSEGGAPVSIIEMAASGMPVVSTTHCDIPEVIGSGPAARLLAPERDVGALIERLEWLVDHPDEWLEMLLAARRRTEHEFDMVEQGNRLAGLYQSLAEGRR